MRVLLVDAVASSADAVRSSLTRAGVGATIHVCCGSDGIDFARSLEPDIAIVDRCLPDMSGVAVVEAITSMALLTRSILVTSDRDVESAVAAVRAGARGCVYRADVGSPRLPRLLDAVMAGEIACPRSLLGALVGGLIEARNFGDGPGSTISSPLESGRVAVVRSRLGRRRGGCTGA